jgi:hypothetical protein
MLRALGMERKLELGEWFVRRSAACGGEAPARHADGPVRARGGPAGRAALPGEYEATVRDALTG